MRPDDDLDILAKHHKETHQAARCGLIARGEFDMPRTGRLQGRQQTPRLIGRQMTYRFTVDFDPEADVWYVRDSTLPGLRTEAPSIDALVGKLRIMVPDLLAASETRGRAADTSREIPFEVVLHTNTQARRPAA